jgi:hypothetical protein
LYTSLREGRNPPLFEGVAGSEFHHGSLEDRKHGNEKSTQD